MAKLRLPGPSADVGYGERYVPSGDTRNRGSGYQVGTSTAKVSAFGADKRYPDQATADRARKAKGFSLLHHVELLEEALLGFDYSNRVDPYDYLYHPDYQKGKMEEDYLGNLFGQL